MLTVSSTDLGICRTEVEALNESDVDLYAWICDGSGSYTGLAWVGTACSTSYKTSITRGPSRYNAIIETAEVCY